MTVRRRAAILLGCATLSLAASGCRDNDDTTTVGTVIEVIDHDDTLGDHPTEARAEIPSGAVLATDHEGSARFRLDGYDLSCKILPASTLVVGPKPGIALAQDGEKPALYRCDRGASTAKAEAGAGTVELGRGDGTVEARGRRADVRVASGEASASADGKTVTVVARKTSSVLPGGPTSPASYNPDRPDLPENILGAASSSTTTTTGPPGSTTTSSRPPSTTTTAQAA